MDSINKKNRLITHSCFQFLIVFNELPLFLFTEFMGDAWRFFVGDTITMQPLIHPRNAENDVPCPGDKRNNIAGMVK